MALVEETLFGKEDKVEKAIHRIKAFAPSNGEPVYVAFSGGKDSQCIYHLCEMAGVPFDAHYSVTSVDPPEVILFIKANYPDVKFEYNYWNDDKPDHHYPDGRPKVITMWSLIADHTIPPTRMARYCCAALKETGGVDVLSLQASAGRKAFGVSRITLSWISARPRRNSKMKQSTIRHIGKRSTATPSDSWTTTTGRARWSNNAT